MRACSACGSVALRNDNECTRCGEKAATKFPHLYNSSTLAIPGVAIGVGCFWLRPKRLAGG